MEIRLANINDAEQIIALINARRELLVQQNRGEHDVRNLPERKQVLDRVSNEEEFVAIQGEKILGVITISNENLAYVGIAWEMKDSSPVYIDWMVVDPSQKDTSLSEELMAFAEKMARIKGAKSIRLNELATGLMSEEFYSSHNYKRVGELKTDNNGTKSICYEKIL